VMGFLLLVVLVVGMFSGGPRSGLDGKVASIVKTHQFSIVRWEVSTILRDEVPSLLTRALPLDAPAVIEYFRLAGEESDLVRSLAAAGDTTDASRLQLQVGRLQQQRHAISRRVEQTIERQIAEVLREQGIYSPFANMHFFFPPVNLKLSGTPNLLVVSPRDRIESINQAMLQPDLTTAEAEAIESRVDGLGVSSLVTGIGGLGATFPTFVADDMGLRETIETSAHEWVHQYLAFKPLGARYVLNLIGVTNEPDITSLNETAANIAGNEIGKLVCEKYYRDKLSTPGQPTAADSGSADAPVFDFNSEMRRIRLHVDELLSEGKASEAEQYMNERRDELERLGYYIRKLNQAYFAFHGSYTDSPTSVDPMGAAMTELRNRSGSLAQFLELVSTIASERALMDAVEG
jgi:hypothetical protein